jgi:uncharacterized cupin superfamily protein
MDRPRPREATFAETEGGRRPEGDGWYVLNIADAYAIAADRNGHSFRLGGEDSFPEYGLNVSVFEPGQVTSLYHAESNQEDFLVLFGECRLLVEGEERRLRQWDFFHAAPWTEHTFVGAGDGPCAVLMVGGRAPDEQIVYPVDGIAARHGASVEQETTDPAQAYGSMGWSSPEPTRKPWPPDLET